MPTADEIEFAFKRLSETIDKLNIYGLLLASTQMARYQRRTEDWGVYKYGRFTFRQAISGFLRVAVCPHPRFTVSQTDVSGAGNTVRAWIEAVMENYRRKPAEFSAD